MLFKAWKVEKGVFDRDAKTRRGEARERLRGETGLTDEAVEGWAVMLGRDPRRLRMLESKFSDFGGAQTQLGISRWTAGEGGSGTEGSDFDTRRGGFRGRGRGGGGGGGRGRGGSAAGPTGEKETEEARRRKEANKGRGANHNRKSQRGKKMARGGFPG